MGWGGVEGRREKEGDWREMSQKGGTPVTGGHFSASWVLEEALLGSYHSLLAVFTPTPIPQRGAATTVSLTYSQAAICHRARLAVPRPGIFGCRLFF